MSTPDGQLFVLGAVAYAPKVVTIWEGFRDWFREHDFPFDYQLFSNYESLVEAQFVGDVDVAWNSPLAWVRSRRLADGATRILLTPVMRDTDQDLTSVVVVRGSDERQALIDLAGARIGVGSIDSPQSRLIPLGFLSSAGPALEEIDVRVFDDVGGKHGDDVRGERAAIEALISGEIEAACIIGANQLAFSREGLIQPGDIRVIGETDPYDHCAFTALEDAVDLPSLEVFSDLLLGMSAEDPDVRVLLELEGLNQWVPGRTSGFAQLESAVDLVSFYDSAGAITDQAYRP